MTAYKTKPGRYGTLYLWQIAYNDVPGPTGERVGMWRTWAYNTEDAWERWYDAEACGEQGFAAIGEFSRVTDITR